MAKNKENLEIKDLKTRYLKNENPGRIVPLSPQNPEGKKGSKYDESRKIKVLRDFLFIFSDTRKTRKSPVWTEYRY